MAPSKKLLLLVLILSSFFHPGKSVGQHKAYSPEALKQLKTEIEKALKETGTPAVGIALVNGDTTVWVAGLGKADLEKDTKATENTMFRIGSVSKMFVSLAILKLQEEGKINLNDKVRDLAPEIAFENPWEKTAPVLVEHLLEHTTGWDDLHLTDYALNDPSLSLKGGLDYHPHTRTSRWMPGTRMAYCNSGPPVAAYIIEKITGKKFEDYIQQNFFQPMGMENMTYFATEPYKKWGATLYLDKKPQAYWNISVRPSGAINASPKDMAKMLRFFVNRGRVDSLHLISEASLKRMETPSSTNGAMAGLESGYGLSNYSSYHKSYTYRSHGGGVNGGLTDFSYLPTHHVGYAIMINCLNGNALGRIAGLIREFQTKNLSPDKTVRLNIPAFTDPDISGHYISINPRVQLTDHYERIVNVNHIWNKKNTVFFQGLFGGWKKSYRGINSRQYVSNETGKIDLVLVKDPIAGDVVHSESGVFKRISPVIIFGQLIVGTLWLLYIAGSLLLGSIWFIRYWRGRKFTRQSIRLGSWPFIASVFFLAVLLLEIGVGDEGIALLGNVTVVSVSITVFTICFALAALLSIITAIRDRKAKLNQNIYWHLTILSCLHFIAACYFGWHGIIGIQTWSY